MLTSPARPLILTFGALLALFNLVALLPGNPDFTSGRGFLIGVVIQALIVWRLWHRSAIAWSLAVLGSVLYVPSVVLFGGPYKTTLIISAFLALVQAAVLFTPDVLSYIFGRDDAVASH